jgi:hypothetical protein
MKRKTRREEITRYSAEDYAFCLPRAGVRFCDCCRHDDPAVARRGSLKATQK